MVPGISVVAPSVLVIATSAVGATISVSMSVAELSAVFGSGTPPGAVTVAVLVSVPLALPLTLQTAV